MTIASFEHSDEVRAALSAIVTDPSHGPDALSNFHVIANLLRDLLPDAPREAGLLTAAAERDVAGILRRYAELDLDPATAIQQAVSAFASTTAYTPAACRWVVGELAVVLGLTSASPMAGQYVAEMVTDATSGPRLQLEMLGPELAVMAADALVWAIAGDKWEAVRHKVARLFGGGQPDGSIERRVDATRDQLAAAEAGELEKLMAALIGQWTTRFADLLADHPDARPELAALVEEIRARSSPIAAGAGLDAGIGQETTDVPAVALHPSPAAGPAPPVSNGPPGSPASAGRTDPVGQLESGMRGWKAGHRRRTDEADRVSRAVRAAVKPGLLAFNPPEEMVQGRKERVEASIARSPELRDALAAGLRGRGEVQFEALPTSTFMGVELRGGSFDIESFSPVEQVVAPTARWEFDVRPLQSGLQTLTLCVSLRLEQFLRTAGPGRIAVPVLERQIRIRVDVGYGTRRFLSRNWQWLVATGVAIAGAIAAWVTIFH